MKILQNAKLRILIVLPVALLISSCDIDWDDDDDDYYYQQVKAEFTVKVRDADTGFELPGAEVRFYADHGDEDDLDLYDTYVRNYTDDDGNAYAKVKAVLGNYNECIGMRAEVEYSDWPTEETGVVKFWYPDGGSYSTTIYVDDNGITAVSSSDANVLSVPSSRYKTIQAAIDAAAPGEYVLVAPGAYEETLDFRGKMITVASEAGPLHTTICGSAETEPVVSFVNGENQYSALTGFTITGGSVGIAVLDAAPTLENNRVESSPLANQNVLAEDLAAENQRLESPAPDESRATRSHQTVIHIGRQPQSTAVIALAEMPSQKGLSYKYLAWALAVLLACVATWKALDVRHQRHTAVR